MCTNSYLHFIMSEYRFAGELLYLTILVRRAYILYQSKITLVFLHLLWILFLSEMGLTRLSWSWSYGSWIYNYLCNWCLSPLMLWVRLSLRVRSTTLCDKVCQWLATGRCIYPGPPVSSPDKTDRHDITEILLKVALNTITLTITPYFENHLC